MVKLEDLKRINLLKNVPDHLLELIAARAQLSIFGADTELISVNEDVNVFYMLIMGQVAIKKEISPNLEVIMDYLQTGASFGTSAFMEDSKASYTAVCQEPCEAITIAGDHLASLFEDNHELAFHMMLGIAAQYKHKMDMRAQMIIKAVNENPDLKNSIKNFNDLTLVA